MGLGFLRTLGALMVVGVLSTAGCKGMGGDAEAKKEASDDDDGDKKKKKDDEEDEEEEEETAEASEDSDESETADNGNDVPNTPPNTNYPRPTTTTDRDQPAAFGKTGLTEDDDDDGADTTKTLADKPEDKPTEDKPADTPPANTGSGKKTATPGRGIPAPPGGRPRPGTK